MRKNIRMEFQVILFPSLVETGLKVTKFGCIGHYNPISQLSSVSQNWIKANMFADLNECLPSRPDLSPLDYHV